MPPISFFFSSSFYLFLFWRIISMPSKNLSITIARVALAKAVTLVQIIEQNELSFFYMPPFFFPFCSICYL